MKNTKGMTLIEVIISLLIISTASLIIVVGFVTALNLFTDSNHYKDVTNKQQKALVDEENKDTDIDVNDTLANYSITVNESGNPIIVNGTYKKATSKTYKDVNLSNFIPKIQINEAVKGRNIYKNYCKMMQEFSNYLKYKYITPCMYISDSTRENLTYKDFFEDEGYKKYVFILVGDKAKKGDRPTDIWALLDNTTVEDDQDTWLIPKSKISTKILENKTYSEFYKIISGNEWIYYTTSK